MPGAAAIRIGRIKAQEPDRKAIKEFLTISGSA
jgi:hypothetical protein